MSQRMQQKSALKAWNWGGGNGIITIINFYKTLKTFLVWHLYNYIIIILIKF